MQDFIDKYPLAFIPLFILVLVRHYLSHRPSHRLVEIGGTLPPRLNLHRTYLEFPDPRMRWTARYGNSLTVGADPTASSSPYFFCFAQPIPL